MHNQKLNDFYTKKNIRIKARRAGRDEYAACSREMINALKLMVGKSRKYVTIKI
jgi:hypothetical protein